MQMPGPGRRQKEGTQGKTREEGQLKLADAPSTPTAALKEMTDVAEGLLTAKTLGSRQSPDRIDAPERKAVANIDLGGGKKVVITGLQAQAIARLAIENESMATAAGTPPTGGTPTKEAVDARVKASMDRIMASASDPKAAEKEVERGLVEREARRAAGQPATPKLQMSAAVEKAIGVSDGKPGTEDPLSRAQAKFDAAATEIKALPAGTKKGLGKDGAISAVMALVEDPNGAAIKGLKADAAAAGADAAKQAEAATKFKDAVKPGAPAAPGERPKLGDDFGMLGNISPQVLTAAVSQSTDKGRT